MPWRGNGLVKSLRRVAASSSSETPRQLFGLHYKDDHKQKETPTSRRAASLVESMMRICSTLAVVNDEGGVEMGRKKVFVWSLARKQRQKKLGMIASTKRTEPMAVHRSQRHFSAASLGRTTSAELAFHALFWTGDFVNFCAPLLRKA